MKYEVWSKDTLLYELQDGFALEKAPWQDFTPWWTLYVVFQNNVWFRQSYDMALSVLQDAEICYWVKKDGNRIGGVLIEPNYMNCLFLVPPFCEEYGKVVVLLRNLLLSWADNTKDIVVGGCKPGEVSYYQRAGFRARESRRCMIRPTEAFAINWCEDYVVAQLSKEYRLELAELFYVAFHGGSGAQGAQELDAHIKNVEFYVKHFGDDEILKKASTMIYDKTSNKLIGACLISLWEQWPLIYDVAVHPKYQGRGLASQMIKQALTVLKEQYPVIRLFVTLGNDAELLYHRLGFLSGDETTEMVIPATNRAI